MPLRFLIAFEGTFCPYVTYYTGLPLLKRMDSVMPPVTHTNSSILILSNQQTPRSKVLLCAVIRIFTRGVLAHLVKNFAFCGNRRFLAVFTTARYWFLPWAKEMKCESFHHIFKPTLMSFSSLCKSVDLRTLPSYTYNAFMLMLFHAQPLSRMTIPCRLFATLLFSIGVNGDKTPQWKRCPLSFLCQWRSKNTKMYYRSLGIF